MSKKLQLKVIVFLCMMIVIFVYFYVSRDFSFNVKDDLGGLKDSIGINADDLSNSNFIKEVQKRFNSVKNKIEDGQEEVLESKISEKVLEKLSYQDNVVYEYEPWGIKLTYDSLMIKEVNQNNEEISFSYENVQDVNLIIKKIILENNFNDWLNDNYDLQNLNKFNYNNLVFWMQDLSDDENKIEEYYFNWGEDLFIFKLKVSNDKKDTYWNSLENIIKSFDLIKDINL
jgi:hypothetical protein